MKQKPVNVNCHIAVLMGGLSSEREVSLRSGEQCALGLTELGYKVTKIDVTRNVISDLSIVKPDVAFIALHGTYGEDGCIQGVLKMLGIAYTHSGILASSLAMYKPMAKTIFRANNIRTPDGEVLSRDEVINNYYDLPKPCVIKPVDEGSSVGVLIARENSQINPEELYNAEQFLVENYIEGRDMTVAVIDEKPLGIIEMVPKSGFFDYTNKYTPGKSDFVVPKLDKAMYNEIMDMAFAAHHALRCHSISRSDFRYDESRNIPYLLEVNTHPGFTSLSLVPQIAAQVGISFHDLLQYLVENAKCQ